MKLLANTFILLSAMILFSFAFVNDTYKLKTDASFVAWTGKKTVGQHNGKLNFSDGFITMKNNQLTGGQFTVDMTSITCEDITDEKTNKDFIGHLKNDDFFAVDKFPKAVFVITSVSPKGDGNYKISGDMTIKGIKKPVSFEGEIRSEGSFAKATATLEIDRTQFDIRYKSKTIFPEIGDKFIYDNFTLALEMAFQK